MGLETILAVALIGLTAASIVTQVAGAAASRDAAKKEAGLQETQGRIIQAEAEETAENVGEENRKFRARQKLLFLKAGVTLEGSPLLILEETKEEGEEEVEAIQRRGAAQLTLSQQQAEITRSQGRAAFIGGIAGATATGASTIIGGASAGIF